jgi:hypothetical protein
MDRNQSKNSFGQHFPVRGLSLLASPVAYQSLFKWVLGHVS